VRAIRLMAGAVRPRRPRGGEAQEPATRPNGVERLPDGLLAEAEVSAAPIEDESLREAVRRAAVARLRAKLG
jgi:hypothetical protein